MDYAVLATYLAANVVIGRWCSRKREENPTAYFLGGRRVPTWAAAVSFFATATSSISFMALPARAFTSDWLSVGSAPAQAFAGVVVGFLLVGILRRLDLTTVYGYLERRFDRRVRLLGAGLGVLLKVTGRISVVMLLPALALSTVTGMNVYFVILAMGLVTTLYSMEGGFEAVVWTDVMQSVVTLGGVAVALGYVLAGVHGGFGAIWSMAAHAGKFHAWSADLDFTRPTVAVFCGMFLAHIFNQVSDQPLMQRMLATSDAREARRTVLIGNSIGLISSFIFFFVGTALWVFYRVHPDRLAPNVATDAIFPYFIANELPRGVVGLIVAAVFAAAMGALSSVMNSVAAIVVSDFGEFLHLNGNERKKVWVARLTTGLAGLFGTSMAAYLAWRNVASLWDEFLKLMALVGGGFPGVFALGFLTRRGNASGAIIGALASIAVTWWVQNYTPIDVFFHGFVATGSCFAIGYIASLVLGRRESEVRPGRLTIWDLKARNPDATAPLASRVS
jgi:SSS family transporter